MCLFLCTDLCYEFITNLSKFINCYILRKVIWLKTQKIKESVGGLWPFPIVTKSSLALIVQKMREENKGGTGNRDHRLVKIKCSKGKNKRESIELDSKKEEIIIVNQASRIFHSKIFSRTADTA